MGATQSSDSVPSFQTPSSLPIMSKVDFELRTQCTLTEPLYFRLLCRSINWDEGSNVRCILLVQICHTDFYVTCVDQCNIWLIHPVAADAFQNDSSSFHWAENFN